jgi:hypothetical protein
MGLEMDNDEPRWARILRQIPPGYIILPLAVLSFIAVYLVYEGFTLLF